MHSPALSDSSPFPRYHQLRLTLRQRIKDGVYSSAFSMPGERELADEFGVGRVTVRSALARLEEEGLVVRLRGKGTVPVQRPEVPAPIAVRGGLLENLLAMGLRTKVQVLERRTCPASTIVAQALHLAPDAPVLKVVRIRKFKRHPISYTEAYISHAFAKVITRSALAESPMLMLLEQQGIKVVSAEQTIGAVVAEPVVARALDVPEGMALLRVRRICMDAAGRPVQFLTGLYHPDRYEYHLRLSRVGGDTKVWIQNDGKPST